MRHWQVMQQCPKAVIRYRRYHHSDPTRMPINCSESKLLNWLLRLPPPLSAAAPLALSADPVHTERAPPPATEPSLPAQPSPSAIPVDIPSAVPSAIPPAVPSVLRSTKPSWQTSDLADLKDFGINGDEQLTLRSVRSDGALVFLLFEDYKTIVSGVILDPTGTIELVLKVGRVLPLSSMKKPNKKATHHLRSSIQLSQHLQSSRSPQGISSRSPSPSQPQSPRLQRCAWCDSHEHTKSACSEFQRVEMSGRVSVNDANRVKYWGTATELPQMIGKGAMKLVYKKLMELEEQLGLTRNYNPSCVNILHGVIRSFSA